MKIGILGCGVVGSEVIRIIDEGKTEALQSLEVVRILARKPRADRRFTTDFNDIVQDSDIDTVVEVMGGIHPAYEYICASLRAKKNVVTANKAVIAKYFKEFNELAQKNQVAFKIEASAGGGIPWIRELQRIQRMDAVSSFSGILNGTTNYILDMMHQCGTSFETALKDAQCKGYAESDPSADIEGYDIQNKCAISASVSYGGYLSTEDIPVFGISSIKKEDIDYFKSKNLVCKLMGQSKNYGDFISLYVCPVCTKGIEGHVGANLNITACTSRYLGNFKMIGQGAGGAPTASALISDLIDILNHDMAAFALDHPLKVDNSQELSHFYLREKIEDFHEELALSYEKDDTYIYMKTKMTTFEELLSVLDLKKDLFIAKLQEDLYENR